MKIAIHGPMCSGKTTVSNIIKKYDLEYKTYSFGGKVKDIGRDLFNMQGKDRSLLIDIASKMREIDNNIWAKYVIKQIKFFNCTSDLNIIFVISVFIVNPLATR